MVTLKQSLNNDVVLMRHLVRKVKVHIIHKLSRNIKVFKQKQDKKHESQRYEKKVERWVEEILTLKKFKEDRISKQIILETRIANNILSDIKSTTAERVLAKIMTFKTISEKINEIRNKYTEDFINEFLKKSKKRSKVNKKNIKNKKKEFDQSLEDQHDDKLQDDKIHKELNEKHKEAKKLLIKDNEKVPLKPEKLLIRDDEKVPLKPEKLLIKDDEKVILVKKKSNKIMEEDEEMISVLHEPKKHKKLIPETQNEDVSSDKNEISKKSELKKFVADSVDPFFLMSNGQDEYLSVVTTEPIDHTENQNKTYTDNLNRRQRRQLKKNGNISKRKFLDSTTAVNKGSFMNLDHNTKLSKEDKTSNSTTHPMSDQLQNLHPSWQAKLLQNSKPVKFEGKKIVFDDQE